LLLWIVWALAAAGADWNELDRSALGYVMSYPAGWIVHGFSQHPTGVKYGLPVLHYDRLEVPDQMEVRVLLLDNSKRRPLDAFFTAPDPGAEVYLPREERTVAGRPSLRFGEAFDPPLYGMIRYRVEILVSIAPDRLLHVEMAALPQVDGEELQLIAFDLWNSIRPAADLPVEQRDDALEAGP